MADPAPLREGQSGLRTWVFGVAIALLVLFVALNSDQVKVNFIVAETKTPLIFALLLATLFGVLIGWLGPRLRHKKD